MFFWKSLVRTVGPRTGSEVGGGWVADATSEITKYKSERNEAKAIHSFHSPKGAARSCFETLVLAEQVTEKEAYVHRRHMRCTKKT